MSHYLYTLTKIIAIGPYIMMPPYYTHFTYNILHAKLESAWCLYSRLIPMLSCPSFHHFQHEKLKDLV